MVEPVFGFCTPQEHNNFMMGVKGFERDLVRQGIVLIKFYFSVKAPLEQSGKFDKVEKTLKEKIDDIIEELSLK